MVAADLNKTWLRSDMAIALLAEGKKASSVMVAVISSIIIIILVCRKNVLTNHNGKRAGRIWPRIIDPTNVQRLYTSLSN